MSDHTDQDDDIEPRSRRAAPEPERGERGRRAYAGDDYDDDDDYYYDDEYDDAPRRSRSRRDTYLLAAAAIVVVIVIAVLVTQSGDDGDDPGGDGSGTTQPAGPTSAGPVEKNWPADVAGAAPEGFVSDQASPEVGLLDPEAEAPEPGVYVWTDFKGWHVRLVRGEGVGQVNGSATGTTAVMPGPNPIGGATATASATGVDFALGSDGELGGIDFDSVGNESITINLTGVEPTKVFTGQQATPAPALPLQFVKSAGQ